jgi:alanine transaminase
VIVVINPGNPTGQVLDKQTIEDILKYLVSLILRFASDKKVTVFADEVYQSNVYVPHKKFHSMRQIKESLPPPYNDVELYSFHSISKGISGECGFRGGYCEISSVDPQVFAEISKSKSSPLL